MRSCPETLARAWCAALERSSFCSARAHTHSAVRIIATRIFFMGRSFSWVDHCKCQVMLNGVTAGFARHLSNGRARTPGAARKNRLSTKVGTPELRNELN